jgi:predicted transcriptional regulator
MPQKTTVYLDPIDYRKLKALAQEVGRPPAAIIREAVAEYARRHGKKRLPKSIGSGRSGRGDVAERTEEYLKGFGLER